MRVLLVASYELGHQPLYVAAPAGLLRERGHQVRCLDLSIEPWDPEAVAWAERVAFSVPMHTAMRIARRAIERVREQQPELPIACFGLYAPFMADVADRALGGETDPALMDWIEHGGGEGVIHLGRGAARAGAPLPARDLLPTLDRYAHLAVDGEERLVGYVEASHGCAHRCRHCPVPVIYDGRLRVVNVDAVIADVTQQVAAGAQHITFGDPDFLNGAHHSLRVVRALHDRFPDLTFDCTVKVEHVLRHEDIWSELAAAGCLFVVSAFESVDDATLDRLDKGHTAGDAARAVTLLRAHGIEVRPSWMPFTPWTSLDQIHALLEFVAEHDLVANVDPVQYTIRLLLPEGSLLLGHPDLTPHLGPYDAERSSYTWRSIDPAMDDLQQRLAAHVEARVGAGDDIARIYQGLRAECGLGPASLPAGVSQGRPRLTESWFCCAEPTAHQLGGLRQSAM
ncbi:MAG: CUAEP/CCAEP-tail radical SAM protein [Acidimicrobiia bacterium]